MSYTHWIIKRSYLILAKRYIFFTLFDPSRRIDVISFSQTDHILYIFWPYEPDECLTSIQLVQKTFYSLINLGILSPLHYLVLPAGWMSYKHSSSKEIIWLWQGDWSFLHYLVDVVSFSQRDHLLYIIWSFAPDECHTNIQVANKLFDSSNGIDLLYIIWFFQSVKCCFILLKRSSSLHNLILRTGGMSYKHLISNETIYSLKNLDILSSLHYLFLRSWFNVLLTFK